MPFASRRPAHALRARRPRGGAGARAVPLAGRRPVDVGSAGRRARGALPRAALRRPRPRPDHGRRRGPARSSDLGARRAAAARRARDGARALLRALDGRADRHVARRARAGADRAARACPTPARASARPRRWNTRIEAVRAGGMARIAAPSSDAGSRRRSAAVARRWRGGDATLERTPAEGYIALLRGDPRRGPARRARADPGAHARRSRGAATRPRRRRTAASLADGSAARATSSSRPRTVEPRGARSASTPRSSRFLTPGGELRWTSASATTRHGGAARGAGR